MPEIALQAPPNTMANHSEAVEYKYPGHLRDAKPAQSRVLVAAGRRKTTVHRKVYHARTMSYMDAVERQEKQQLLITLENEHAALDKEVALTTATIGFDQLYIGRLKRRKLKLKDMIVRLRSSLLPDYTA